MRLRWIHRNLNKTEVDRPRRKKLEDSGGPKPKVEKIGEDVCPDLNTIATLNSSTDESEILRLMKETLEHRNQIRRSSEQSVLRVYSKFAESGVLVRNSCLFYKIKR